MSDFYVYIMMQNILLVSLIITVLVLAPVISHYGFANKADTLAKKKIIKGLEKFAGGPSHWSRYCTVSGTLKDNQTKTVYDKACVIVIPPPVINQTGNGTVPNPLPCNIKEHLENGTCIPDVEVPPVINETIPPVVNETIPPVVNETAPPTNNSYTKIDFTGDVSGTAVLNALVKEEPDLVVVAGDLGYQSTLSWFKTNYEGDLGEELKCLVGNHDAAEDGSASLEKQTIAYCGAHWYMKMANSTTLLIGFNSNGDDNTEISYIKSITGDPTIMNGVKNVILMSHKNGHVPPNSHHPAEVANVYSAVNKIPNVRVFEVNAHNHVMATAPYEDWFISGAGGKIHYSC